MTYTVIGFFEETGQTFAHEVLSDDPYYAMREVAKKNLHGDSDAAILGAIERTLPVMFVAACHESGKLAYACDLGEHAVA